MCMTRSSERETSSAEERSQDGDEGLVPLLHYYYERCVAHRVSPNAHIAIALQCGRRRLGGVPGAISICDMMPLIDVLEHDQTVSELLLDGCALSSSACYALRDALEHNGTVTSLDLSKNGIDADGGAALRDMLLRTRTLRRLKLRGNSLGEAGLRQLAEGIAARGDSLPLVQLDVSNNAAEHAGVRALQSARSKYCVGLVQLVDTGNCTREELLNSLTHGFGVLLSLVGGIAIIRRAASSTTHHQIAAYTYAASLFSLYLSSTLCHCFFLMERVGAVFGALDTAMINVLIAGRCPCTLSLHMAHPQLFLYSSYIRNLASQARAPFFSFEFLFLLQERTRPSCSFRQGTRRSRCHSSGWCGRWQVVEWRSR